MDESGFTKLGLTLLQELTDPVGSTGTHRCSRTTLRLESSVSTTGLECSMGAEGTCLVCVGTMSDPRHKNMPAVNKMPCI